MSGNEVKKISKTKALNQGTYRSELPKVRYLDVSLNYYMDVYNAISRFFGILIKNMGNKYLFHNRIMALRLNFRWV